MWVAAVVWMQAAGPVLPSWWELPAIVVLMTTVGMMLIRYRLREPPKLATTDEVAALAKEVASLRLSVEKSERSFKESCVTKGELNGFGDRLAIVERTHLTLEDRTIKAIGRSTRALREVADVKDRLENIAEKVETVPEQLGRIDERLSFLMGEKDRRNRHTEGE